MINDNIAEKICLAVIRHRHVLCTQPAKAEADVDGMEFHEWLNSHGVKHAMRRTNRETHIRIVNLGSVAFATDKDVAATLGRTIFDITEHEK